MTDVEPAEYCANPAHTMTTLSEGDYDRCGNCGLRLSDDDPRATPIGPAASPQADIFDATSPPGVQQLPAVTTSMTPEQFKTWLKADGTLFMVILPANRTFIIKVPAAHHEFFVAMMQQVRFALGPEVQAVRMNVVSGDPPAADGTAAEAPPWAQPAPPTEHVMRDAEQVDPRCRGCGADVDQEHAADCPTWAAMRNDGDT